MGAAEVYLKLWQGLRLRWHLRGTGVLKWQFCNEVLSAASKQYQEKVPEMHQGCDGESRTAVADAFQWGMFSNKSYLVTLVIITCSKFSHVIILLLNIMQ